MLEQAVMALIDVVGSHPDFNGPLGEALTRRGVNLSSVSLHVCTHVGTAYTTPTYLLRDSEEWEARAGIAIMGSTNMSEEELDRLSPFDEKFFDNYASGRGATPAEAIAAMNKDRGEIAASLWH